MKPDKIDQPGSSKGPGETSDGFVSVVQKKSYSIASPKQPEKASDGFVSVVQKKSYSIASPTQPGKASDGFVSVVQKRPLTAQSKTSTIYLCHKYGPLSIVYEGDDSLKEHYVARNPNRVRYTLGFKSDKFYPFVAPIYASLPNDANRAVVAELVRGQKIIYKFRLIPLTLKNAIVPTSINGKAVQCLLDTGSNFTIVRRSFVEQQLVLNFTKENTFSAYAANDTLVRFVGSIPLLCNFAGVQININFLVAEDNQIPTDALIGIDVLLLLNKHGIQWSMDLYRRLMYIGKHCLALTGLKMCPEEAETLAKLLNSTDCTDKCPQNCNKKHFLKPDDVSKVDGHSFEILHDPALDQLNGYSSVGRYKKGDVVALQMDSSNFPDHQRLNPYKAAFMVEEVIVVEDHPKWMSKSKKSVKWNARRLPKK